MSFNKAIDISFSACHAWSEIFRIGKKISFGTFVAIRHATYRWSFRDTSDVAACHSGRLKGDVQRLFAEDKAAQLVSRNSGSNTQPLLLILKSIWDICKKDTNRLASKEPVVYWVRRLVSIKPCEFISTKVGPFYQLNGNLLCPRRCEGARNPSWWMTEVDWNSFFAGTV